LTSGYWHPETSKQEIIPQKKLVLAPTIVAKTNHFFLLIRQLPACRTGRKLTANENEIK
jgi:hypothetical protein